MSNSYETKADQTIQNIVDNKLSHLNGKKFGNWTVIKYLYSIRSTFPSGYRCTTNIWLCECACGSQVEVRQSNLKQQASKGCRNCATKNRYSDATKNGIPSWLWNNLINHAKSLNRNVTITPKHLKDLLEKQGWRCAISGLPIKFASKTKYKKETTASVDRIDSNKGYVKGNVWWVHKKINSMKNNYTMTEFISLCEAVIQHSREK